MPARGGSAFGGKKVIIVIIMVLVGVFWYLNYSLSGFSGPSGSVYFTVESGQSLNEITSKLYEAHLIRNELIFKLYAKVIGQQSKIIAGEHLLSNNLKAKEILNILTTVSSDNERKITIIEGWRTEDIANYLEKNNIVDKSDFLQAVATSNWQTKYDFLVGVKAKTLEGFLFPDTYRIFADATANDIVKKMLDNFDSKLTTKMRSDMASQNKNIFEVVTLASIIEREVPQDADKKIVADIFLKRIKAGIALQSDATVNYITGKGQAQPSYDDLKVDSLYNTYKYRGLPPGPISNPGLKSLEAVIYPTPNQYYYFLTTLDSGTVIYSRTYEEHLNNKAKYLD